MFKKNKEIKEQARRYRVLRGEEDWYVKNVVRLSDHQCELVEFECLRTGKTFGLHRLGSTNRVLGFARGWNEEEIQVYAKFLEILLGAKIEEVKDIFVTLEEVEGAKTE
ncbi:TPA: hypothetical protein U1V29_002049 [Streptococcus suis]|nr:hypothetical protein [Streptococcus suis]